MATVIDGLWNTLKTLDTTGHSIVAGAATASATTGTGGFVGGLITLGADPYATGSIRCTGDIAIDQYGHIGMGIAPNGSYALLIQSVFPQGGGVGDGKGVGISSDCVFNTSTIEGCEGFWARCRLGAGVTTPIVYDIIARDAQWISTPGTLTTQVGFYAYELTLGTKNYALYTAGATQSRFEGKVGFGNLDAVNQITIGANENATLSAYSAGSGTSFSLEADISGGSTAAPTICGSSSQLMAIDARGYDGTAYRRAAEIVLSTDGIVGSGSMPGKIVFSTTPTATTTAVTRLTIDATGLSTFTGAVTVGGLATLSAGVTVTGTGTFNNAVTVTGKLTATADPTSVVSLANNATNAAITDDNTTNASMYPVWVTASTGNLPAKVSSTKMTWNPSTSTLDLGTGTFAGASLVSALRGSLAFSSASGGTATLTAGSGTAILVSSGLLTVSGGITAGGALTAGSGTVAVTDSTGKLAVISSTNYQATTSAQLAGVISDETGSGALVFATSPTLVTPTLGVASGTSLTTTGNIGIGIAVQSAISLYVQGAGTEWTGISADPQINNTSTNGTGHDSHVRTAASAFTLTNAICYNVQNASKGAGSTITNNYGIKIAAQTAGSNNWAINSAGGEITLVLGAATTGTTVVVDGSNNIRPLSSSERFKEDVEPWQLHDDELDAFLAAVPKHWNYIGEESGALGFTSEQLDALPTRNRYGRSPFVNYDINGRVTSNRDFAILAAQHQLIQRLYEEVAQLKELVTDART